MRPHSAGGRPSPRCGWLLTLAAAVSQWRRAAALACAVCEHMGGLSVVPDYAPSTRVVIDAPARHCHERRIQCRAHETFCISAIGQSQMDRFWLIKGCTDGAAWPALEPLLDRAEAVLHRPHCVTDSLDSRITSNFPAPAKGATVGMHVCVCNDADECNAAGASRRRRPPAAADVWQRHDTRDAMLTERIASNAGRSAGMLRLVVAAAAAVIAVCTAGLCPL